MWGWRWDYSDDEFVEHTRRAIKWARRWKWPWLLVYGAILATFASDAWAMLLQMCRVWRPVPADRMESGLGIGLAVAACIVGLLHLSCGWLAKVYLVGHRRERLLVRYFDGSLSFGTSSASNDANEIHRIRNNLPEASRSRLRNRLILCAIVFAVLVIIQQSTDSIATAFGINPRSNFWWGVLIGSKFGLLFWSLISHWLKLATENDRVDLLLVKYYDLCRDGHGVKDD